MRLNHTTEVPEYLWEAARVSRFMQDERLGRWQLQHFTVTEDEYKVKLFELQFKPHPELEMQRAVPPGNYIALRRRMIHDEKLDVIRDQKGDGTLEAIMESRGISESEAIDLFIPPDTHDWIPVMSDTPAEILEHDHALNNATGVVVITGLGLGCLPHALLEKVCDECNGRGSLKSVLARVGNTTVDCRKCNGTGLAVKHIHIIEIDPEVIALTGKYLTDPRVTIHQGSALDVARLLPDGLYVDYVWHDIWTHVSSRNFDAATAEHGISYRMLFDLYEQHLTVKQQGAWAYREALIQKEELDRRDAEELEFQRKVRALPLDEQVELAWRRIMDRRIFPACPWGPDDEIPLEHQRILDPDFRLKAHLYEKMGAPDFWEEFDSRPADGDTPLGRPNAHLEAT